MAKTKPIGVRFDSDLLKTLSEDKIADSPQKVLNFLTQFYLKNKKLRNNLGLEQNTQLFGIKDPSVEVIKDLVKSHIKLELTGDIEAKIAKIQQEEIPPERDTSLGRKVWYVEQQRRIEELRN